MNHKRNILLMLVCTYHALGAYNGEERQFIAKYAVDPNIKKILDAHADELNHKLDRIVKRGYKRHQTWTFSWLPGYFVKYDIKRVVALERVKNCIEKHKLHLLGVPDKRLYHVKGRPEKLHNLNYLVVVKEIQADPNFQTMSLEHIQQLSVLMQETGFIDLIYENYIRSYDNKLVIIDTDGTFDTNKILNRGYMRLISGRHDINIRYTQEALAFILKDMAELLAQRGADRNQIYKIIKHHLSTPNPSWNYLGYFEQNYAEALKRRHLKGHL